VGHIISIHSFRGGTGKSNLTANLASSLARRGARVAVVDTDVNSPGIHVLFRLDVRKVARTLNDYLFGDCGIAEAAYAVSLDEDGTQLHLIPSSMDTGAIARVLREGYDVEKLNDGFAAAIDELRLDYLFIDTHPGLNEETLLAIAISDALVIVLRPDEQDYLGTGVTVEVARRLAVPRLWLVVNKCHGGLDADEVRHNVSTTYGADVLAVLPHSEDLLRLGSAGVFALRHPGHPLTAELHRMAAQLAEP
jgi:MinD-like ATPase involved in chromosome partitioning or flagellar assembly